MGKNKSERRPKKSGGHKKKMKHAMVARARDIDSSSCYTSSSASGEEEEVGRLNDQLGDKRGESEWEPSSPKR
jgi:hypothetical protein